GSQIITHLDAQPFDKAHRPSVDVMFCSAAEIFGGGTIGLVMTGMGDDGREGAQCIKAKKGIVLAEAEESCVVFGMPRAVIEAGLAMRIVPLERILGAVLEAVYGEDPNRR